MTQAQTQKTLYEQDLVAWLDETAVKLRQNRFDEIEIDRLIEEIEGLAGRDRRELRTHLTVLLSHLLKRIYVTAPDDYRGWEITIREQRRQLNSLLEQSPSLKIYWAEVFPDCWQAALSDVQEDYAEVQFSDQWPFSKETDRLLSERFWNGAF